MKEQIVHSAEIAGRTLQLETGKLAGQAHGAVLARYGDTVVLSTVVASNPREGIDFFPLSVEYEERLYAGGIIKGSRWVKREGRPTDEAILNARLIDRSIRPLFPKEYKEDVQVVVTVLSIDDKNDPAPLALVATSAALSISGIPWDGPIALTKVGLIEDELVLNPFVSLMSQSSLNLDVSATEENVLMVEMGGNEIDEDTVLEAINYGHNGAKEVIALIKDFAQQAIDKNGVGYEYKEKELSEEEQAEKAQLEEVVNYMDENFPQEYLNTEIDKATRNNHKDEFITETIKKYAESDVSGRDIASAFEDLAKKNIRKMIKEKGVRIDGRKVDEVRKITVDVGVLPRTHGSAVFQRGETQVLNITTLGSSAMEQLIETAAGEHSKRYIHHYNFPPFSVGETGRVGSPKRREIGHGALAERAIEPVIPSSDDFPYTMRLVSEVLSSNGSTSMASVCGSSLSLMDAGVPISAPVSGIAMGLIKEGDDVVVLTDIQGIEDFYGDMDFKVAGTEKGITAMQMDVKIKGISNETFKTALAQAREGRLHILGKMNEVLSEARNELSQYAPQIRMLKINPAKIGEIIGPGGKIIRALQEATETEINIEEDGTVHVAGINLEGIERAVKEIDLITKEVEVGQVYDGTVTRLMNFGAFVEILPGREGLVHISELAPGYVEKVDDEVKEGDKIKVKVIEIDDQNRVNLSRKALMGDERKKDE